MRLCSNDHYISKESFGLKFRVKYLVKPIRQLPHNIKSFQNFNEFMVILMVMVPNELFSHMN